jgi:hypothetical protein
LWVVLVDELNEFVAINPLEIALCEREIPGTLVEASGWYYEQPLPEGRKNYTKTAPIQFEEFAPCISWWKKREETPVRYLTLAHVQRDRILTDNPRFFEVTPEEFERWRLLPGDLLIIEGNGSAEQIGRTALFRGEIDNCVHQDHVIRIRPDRLPMPRHIRDVEEQRGYCGHNHTRQAQRPKRHLIGVPAIRLPTICESVKRWL